MFLDPEPKRSRQSMAASPFFSAQMPAEKPDDQRWRFRRKPLQERSESRNNQQSLDTEPAKPTIRLVKHSPSPSAHTRSSTSDSSTFDDIQIAKEVVLRKHEGVVHRSSHPEIVPSASVAEPGFVALSVSDLSTPANEAQKLELPCSITLLPKGSTHVVPRTAWHRRSGSSGNYSNSSTLNTGDISLVLASSGRSERLSQGTTLRGTPTPYELEHRERLEAKEAVQGPAQALETLQEASPERPTVRAVPPSIKSPVTGDQPGSGPSESSSPRPQTAPSVADSERGPFIPRNSSRRRSSAGPQTAHPTVTERSQQRSLRGQLSGDSLATSETVFTRPSSPIVVVYDSDSSRPRSQSQPLHHTPSIESIQSRLQSPTIIQPISHHDIVDSSSWASLRSSSSIDTLSPIHIPKRRAKKRPASLSLGSGSNLASGSTKMDMEDVDTLPYPRQAFSSHLSTIASESDWQSRINSQRLSHFSLGSGVLTGDDSSGARLSGTWTRKRRESAPTVSGDPDSTPSDEAGDMTLGIFREESAKPQPLFKRTPRGSEESRKYEGPLPPLPPKPRGRESDEIVDRVSNLQTPSLRPSRSGYSLRQRSNSTPSGSNSHSRHLSQASNLESDRWSYGSSIFPLWAKQFYAGNAQLLSASKITLSSNTTPRPQRPPHARHGSQWTERSVTSRLGTGYSEIDTESPASSHFLPSIFRPRTRIKGPGDSHGRSSDARRSKRTRPSAEGGRPDSLAIFEIPLPETGNAETLPSGQPKWGTLKDSPTQKTTAESRRPLPRKYSKQKHWNDMQFPRPMTKDRLSDLTFDNPQLKPTPRQHSRRLSAWRPPSVVESLDTLINSRCNRQILLFCLGFICPLLWMLASVLPLPKRPSDADESEKGNGASEEDVQSAMMKHEAGFAERRWRDEKTWTKARWWRTLNRVMSVIGVLIIGAVIAIAVVSTR
ncbi:hypothetical protein BAUCODRAFT_487064 [Baudoinia panamericana UAMH 10762]|uniref:Serine-rich protein n=1 Tax=Baudoinia panamericana (strain UAMH 10762) TaxID=717646 RepID=M2MYN9_BAUPA|nr:uncharacterized protein BAUCODRAFT_487064 [Baudoinia panamericana UAMH 10762]EMC96723.1 hypothetical protein BAUCODRAFT_487064 [Baudoinia panamericana UAMH 10762]